MIRGEIQAADYRAEVAAVFEDKGGVRCTFIPVGNTDSVTAQLGSVGDVTLTYTASPESDPVLIFHGFMRDLVNCKNFAMTNEDGTLTVE